MMKFLSKSKIFLIFMIFINVYALGASEQMNTSGFQVQSSFTSGNIINQLFNEDGNLSYDSIIRLLEEAENGILDDVCSESDWSAINHFVSFLATKGTMPNATEEEKVILKNDIQSLLNQSEYNDQFENRYYDEGDCQIMPAVYCGQYDNLLCKS